MPLTINVTVMNGMGVVGSFVKRPVWQPVSSDNSDKIDVSISYSQRIWPWSGWMAVRIGVSKPVSEEVFVKGQVSLCVYSLNSRVSEQSNNREIILKCSPRTHFVKTVE